MESSIENILDNFNSKNEISKTHEWSIRDFNNVETADRKLIVNKKFEFWVHDDALCYFSDYFSDEFGRSYSLDSKLDMNISIRDEEGGYYKKSEITIPYEELFLDILLWIYTRDGKKLVKAAKTFTSLLYLISLGIYLKMKAEFFEILLTKLNFNWKLEYFSDKIWSRSIFTYAILERIVDEMKTKNYIKIIALLSWLKDCETEENSFYYSKRENQHHPTCSIIKPRDYSFISTFNLPMSNDDILTSFDLYLVRCYIKRYNLMSNLTQKEVADLFSLFPHLHSAFDTEKLITEFIYVSNRKLLCIICKKNFESPLQVLDSVECTTTDAYHPKNFIKNNEKNSCLHEGCLKKLLKNEFSCCHKLSTATYSGQINNNNIYIGTGCTYGEGKHILIIED